MNARRTGKAGNERRSCVIDNSSCSSSSALRLSARSRWIDDLLTRPLGIPLRKKGDCNNTYLAGCIMNREESETIETKEIEGCN